MSTQAEQDAVLAVADEMGRILSDGFCGMLATQHPEGTVILWGKKFQENFSRVARMSPEEYAVYRKGEDEAVRLWELRQDLIDARVDLHNAQWKYKRVRAAARKDKVNVNDTFEMLQVRGRENAHQLLDAKA